MPIEHFAVDFFWEGNEFQTFNVAKDVPDLDPTEAIHDALGQTKAAGIDKVVPTFRPRHGLFVIFNSGVIARAQIYQNGKYLGSALAELVSD